MFLRNNLNLFQKLDRNNGVGESTSEHDKSCAPIYGKKKHKEFLNNFGLVIGL